LSVLAGLRKPDRGQVLLQDKPLSAYAPRELARHRAFLPQNPRCDWPLPVERLVALGLTPTLPVFGGFCAEDAERIETALTACDLLGHRQQAATTLSGGELARAMLARAKEHRCWKFLTSQNKSVDAKFLTSLLSAVLATQLQCLQTQRWFELYWVGKQHTICATSFQVRGTGTAKLKTTNYIAARVR
jgi:ABC-type hemin transport system ATPase subunit